MIDESTTWPVVISKGFAELSPGELYELLRLRAEVFVVEQQCAYVDLDGRDKEPGARHWWIPTESGTVATSLRTLAEPDGSVRIGRVVSAVSARGHGLAERLIRHVHDATDNGSFVLDAQSYLVDWYRRLGYTTIGDEFIEDGIAHTPMRRS